MFCLTQNSPELSPTDYHLFKHFDNFLTGKIFANQDQARTSFVDFIESRASNFYGDGINRPIKLNKYSLRHYSLKWTHKNGQNFWNNLILYIIRLWNIIWNTKMFYQVSMVKTMFQTFLHYILECNVYLIRKKHQAIKVNWHELAEKRLPRHMYFLNLNIC